MGDDNQAPFDMSYPPTPIGRPVSFDSDDAITICSDLFTTMELPPKAVQPSPPTAFMETLRGRFPDGPPIIIVPTGPEAGLGYTKRPTETRISLCDSRHSQEFVQPKSGEHGPHSRRSSVGRWCSKAASILKTHHDEFDEPDVPQLPPSPLPDPRSPASDDSSAVSTPQTALFSLFDSSTTTTMRQTSISFRDSASSGSLLTKPTSRPTKRTHPLNLTPIQGSPNPADAPDEPFPSPQKKRPSLFALNWLRRPETPLAEPTAAPLEPPVVVPENPDSSVQSSVPEKKTVRIVSPPPSPPASGASSTFETPDADVRDLSFVLLLLSYLDFSLPAKSLFIYGFILGPWCFLIGAYFLSKSGNLPLLDRDGKLLPQTTMSMLKRQPLARHLAKRVNQSIDASNNWDMRERCRSRSSSPGPPGEKSNDLRSLKQPRTTKPRVPILDEECIWVRRCRFASLASALLLFLAIITGAILIALH